MSAMALLDAHLEQISLCAASIAELSFPPPKIFTNALLKPHHITALIRDTELHERALFTVPTPEQAEVRSRRTTTFQPNGSVIGGSGANAVRAPRRNTAVASVLGGDLVDRIRRGGGGGVGTGIGYAQPREKGEVDVEVLLEGAERLCSVYPVPGAMERITSLRQRYQRLASSIDSYEQRIAEQAEQLSSLNRPHDFSEEEEEKAERQQPAELAMTAEDMKREEQEVKELEEKRQMLEARVFAMEQDIRGVQR